MERAEPRASDTGRRALVGCVLALAVGLLVANALCLRLTNSTDVFVWHEGLDYSVRRDGQVHRHRSEGWADTRIGRYGVNAIPDIREIQGPKLVFWGDSHVEGFPLSDRDKLAQQFNRLADGVDALPTAFAVGLSGATIGTAYHLLPKYEAIAPPVVHHVFVITRMGYLLPQDEGSAEPVSLRSRPHPHFVTTSPRRPSARTQALLDLAQRLRFPLPYQVAHSVSGLDLRFGLGGTGGLGGGGDATDPARAATEPEDLRRTWGFLLDRLTERATAPVAFAYCPQLPDLDRGRLVVEDPDRELTRVFAEASRQRGVPFLHLGDDFVEFHRASGRFPRGFANNHPYRGHLNADGTRLLADKVAGWLAE